MAPENQQTNSKKSRGKTLVRDELFVDGKPVDNKQYDKILKHYKAEMKAKLMDQIRRAERSPTP